MSHPSRVARKLCALLPVTLLCSASALAAGPLPAYRVNPAEVSISGLSSGGYMATQLHVAYSATFRKGAGIVAGGPFNCAQGSLGNALGYCMNASSYFKPPTSTLISITDSWASSGAIDPTSNLRNSRVYLFSGNRDTTVTPAVMAEANNYYKHYVANENIRYNTTVASEHAMVTDDYGNACATKASPYISNCGFDLAGDILNWIYGAALNPRKNGALTGRWVEFDQAEFIASPTTHGMADTGWAYVPEACAAGGNCRLHVVLHGCKQGRDWIGDQYRLNTGYNRWADANNFIMLYPQLAHSSTGNPNGCWDWWGYDDANHAKKSGRQMAAIKGMVDRVVSGFSALPAPTGLAVGGVTTTSITLGWNSVTGAVSYRLWRNGQLVPSGAISSTTYTDTGLAEGTTYQYKVSAVDSSGAEGAQSAPVSGTTSGSPPAVLPPSGLSASSITSNALTLNWSAATGAVKYNVYRGTTAGGPYNRANGSDVAGTQFRDTGLNASTSYYYVVRSVNAGGAESANSGELPVKTAPAWTCTQTSASNYAHVSAGRATTSMGWTYAKGSNQAMGLYNIFNVTTLAETAPGHFIVGNCP